MNDIYWENLTKNFKKFAPGTILADKSERYFIKSKDSISHHLEDSVIEIYTGEIYHFSCLTMLYKVNIEIY